MLAMYHQFIAALDENYTIEFCRGHLWHPK